MGRRCASPITAENAAAFGRVPTRWESTGGYPVLRVVALMVLRQHVLTALALGAYRDSELGLAAALWPQLPDASLVILDREFAAYALYHQLGAATRQRHWLTRARTGRLALRRRVVQRLGPGDALVELMPSAEARRLVRHARATCRPHCGCGRSAIADAASAPRRSSPRCAIRWPTPPPSSSRSTTNAGSSSSASTK